MKMFKLVTRSVMSLCVTRFGNSISQIENSEPQLTRKGAIHVEYLIVYLNT